METQRSKKWGLGIDTQPSLCAQEQEFPSSLSPRMTFSTLLGKLHHFRFFIFSPKHEAAVSMPWQRGWDSFNCLQHAPKSHQVRFTQERRGSAPEMHPPPISDPLEAAIVGRAGIQVGP